MLLLIASNETTTNLLSEMFDIFAQHPEKFDTSAPPLPDSKSSRETVALLITSAKALPHSAKHYPSSRDHSGHARVLLSLGAANRDPQVFD